MSRAPMRRFAMLVDTPYIPASALEVEAQKAFEPPGAGPTFGRRFATLALRGGALAVFLGVLIVFSVTAPFFLTVGNIGNVLGQSAIAGVLAIGDAASYRHWFTGADVRLESVQNATDHARLAARTILGHDDSYSAVPWFWSDIGDMKLQMVGLALGGDHHVVAGDAAENKFSVYHYAGDRLIAAESINRPADHMLGRKMLGAGFSPAPGLVAGGSDALKAALAAFQQESPSAAAG